MRTELTVSIIVPSHNRKEALQNLLKHLEKQTAKASIVEVIVVADGCTDDTLSFLGQVNCSFPVRIVELPGMGAAIARNAGAQTAAGDILLFLDDDIEPSEGLVEAHLVAQDLPEKVVIGYLPYVPLGQMDDFQKNLRSWWEDKFYAMRSPGYRFHYQDLLSGNFSLSARLFRQVGGFDPSLACKEDYELGIRLINSRAAFCFEPLAWGYHRDRATSFARSLQRKKLEGRADVQLGKMHPSLATVLHKDYLHWPLRSKQKMLFSLMRKAPWVTAAAAGWAGSLVPLFLKLGLRHKWQRFNYVLHKYWYLHGVTESLQATTIEEWIMPKGEALPPQMILDLSEGTGTILGRVEEERPSTLLLQYKGQEWFRIEEDFGYERLKAAHVSQLMLQHKSSLYRLLAAGDQRPDRDGTEAHLSDLSFTNQYEHGH